MQTADFSCYNKNMIQRTYDPESEEQFAWMISSLKDPTLYSQNRAVFIQLFFSRFTESEARRVLDFMHAELPRAKIAGMSLYGDANVNLNTQKFIRLNICQFDESDTAIFEYDAQSKTPEDIARDFKQSLSTIKNAKGVLVLASGLTFNISRFMENASAGNENIPFFGAVSNINTADSKFVNPYVLATHTIENGIVAVVFFGDNLHFHTEYTFGWKPIGKQFAVETGTATTIGDTLVTKIDGKPATEIFKRYLDVDPDRHFVSNICEFPLVVERNGVIQARIPCGFNQKGEFNVMGDIKNGEQIRFSYGKTDDILRDSYHSQAKMAEFLPQGIFLYVCANRAIFMKDRAWEEIDGYSKIAPNLMYCHGFAELYRYKNHGGVFNSTLISVGLREGERDANGGKWHTVLPKGLVSFDVQDSDFTSRKTQENGAQSSVEIAKERWINAVDAVQKPKTALHTSNGIYYMEENAVEDHFSTQKDMEAGDAVHSMFERPLGKSIPLSDRLVTFLEATTADLACATEEAKAASKAKSDFLSNMSHEIRTPINAVLGLDEMILRESAEQNIKNYARDIQSAGRALLAIVNDILDFSKIEAGKMEIIESPYDLRQVVNDLTNMVAARAESKGLEFIVDVDETIPHLLYGDSVRIQQCALNILTNAVKYTRKGRVMLSIGAEETAKSDEIELCISVHDTGIGIKEEDLKKLASPFERIEESRNRSIEGTGLGMSIVNGLLKKMGSELIVQSEYGEGSRFSFAVKQKVRDAERIGTYAEAREALQSTIESSYRESFQAPSAEILVIDDTPMNIAVFRGLLKATRCKIDSAESADEGLTLTRTKKYDILFVDHLMPKKDGIAFLHELRADSGNENSSTVCIALTANAVSGAKEMYMEAGFNGYLTKPIDPPTLEATISANIPKEKLLHKGDTGYAEDKNGWDGTERRKSCVSGSAEELFCTLFDLDINAALQNCGTTDTFLTAVNSFYEAIEENASTIERAFAEKDWNTFTIKVHALKSSAKLIGAKELSEQAKALERAGDILRGAGIDKNTVQQPILHDGKDKNTVQNAIRADGKTENIVQNQIRTDEMAENTEKLLFRYRGYEKTLCKLLSREAKNADAHKTSDSSAKKKPMLDKMKLSEALYALNEVVSAFDFDTAELILSELESFSLQDEIIEPFRRVRKSIKDVDAQKAKDSIAALLEII